MKAGAFSTLISVLRSNKGRVNEMGKNKRKLIPSPSSSGPAGKKTSFMDSLTATSTSSRMEELSKEFLREKVNPGTESDYEKRLTRAERRKKRNQEEDAFNWNDEEAGEDDKDDAINDISKGKPHEIGEEVSMDKLRKLMASLNKGEKISDNDIQRTMIAMLITMMERENEVNDLKEAVCTLMEKEKKLEAKVASLEKALKHMNAENAGMKDIIKTNEIALVDMKKDNAKKNEEISERLCKNEVLQAKRGIIIRGVKEANNETQKETENRIETLVTKMLETKVDRPEMVRRLPISAAMKEKAKEEKRVVYRPVLVRFNSMEDKISFFKSLHKLANFPDVKIAVSNEIPLCYRALNNELEAKAKVLRQQQGLRTRVLIDGQKLCLQARKKDEKKWELVEN